MDKVSLSREIISSESAFYDKLIPYYSVVVPTYRSAKFVGSLVGRLDDVLAEMGKPYEIILVDDCSLDNTWSTLKSLRSDYQDNLKLVRLMKNSGQHNAILCGFQYARGEIVITMDDDLQHLPEDIPKLVGAIEDGNDLAIGSYDEKQHEAHRNLAGSVIDRIIRGLYGLPRDFQLTSFRAIRGSIVQVAKQVVSPYPYVTCILFDQASRVTNVSVSHKERASGESSYSFGRSLLLAFNLLFSYSSLPLFFATAFCGFTFLLSVALFSWVLVSFFGMGQTTPGWASIFAAVTFFSSLILGSLSVIGVYVGRMHQQMTGRRIPYYVDEFIQ